MTPSFYARMAERAREREAAASAAYVPDPCDQCGHDEHDGMLGLAPTLFACDSDGCRCGHQPCRSCGEYWDRAYSEDKNTATCLGCGFEETVIWYA